MHTCSPRAQPTSGVTSQPHTLTHACMRTPTHTLPFRARSPPASGASFLSQAYTRMYAHTHAHTCSPRAQPTSGASSQPVPLIEGPQPAALSGSSPRTLRHVQQQQQQRLQAALDVEEGASDREASAPADAGGDVGLYAAGCACLSVCAYVRICVCPSTGFWYCRAGNSVRVLACPGRGCRWQHTPGP